MLKKLAKTAIKNLKASSKKAAKKDLNKKVSKVMKDLDKRAYTTDKDGGIGYVKNRKKLKKAMEKIYGRKTTVDRASALVKNPVATAGLGGATGYLIGKKNKNKKMKVKKRT